MKKEKKNDVVVYQAPSGAIELRGDVSKETIWATLNQLAELFEIDKSGISRHINNIMKSGELGGSTVAKFATVQNEGDRTVTRQIEYYNLDMILSVGYRVNSKKATAFRQWATKTLREFIVNGYVVNKRRIAKNYESFMKAVESIKALLSTGSTVDTDSVIELIKTFADTWFSLSAYDKGAFGTGKITRRKVVIAAEDLSAGIAELKSRLIEKGEASDLFALTRQGSSLEGIVGNVMQTFDGKDLYPGIEEKAAHLLYFIVKNHPFADGNKRSGAFAFVWFLRRTGVLNTRSLTPSALTALTLLIAESPPKDKEKMIGLVVMLLRKQ
jgi:prophage maintenance system killer protein